MAANPVHLMSVEEFRQLPKTAGDFDYELHNGELVPVPRPKLNHGLLQKRLVMLLEEFAPEQSLVDKELAFRLVPEHDLRAADVGYLSRERYRAARELDEVFGAPDLMIEVLSPSNSAREMYECEQLCLTHGCQEFWVVDLEKKTVRVARNDAPAATYKSGDEVPLQVFGTGRLTINLIFAAE